MASAYEFFRVIAKELDDPWLDDSRNEKTVGIDRASRSVLTQTITLRGRLDDVPVVLMYESHYFALDNHTMYPDHLDVFSVFTTARNLLLEGRVRPLRVMDRLARLVGRGGLVGAHPLYAHCRVDRDGHGAPLGDAACDVILGLFRDAGCLEMSLQASTGCDAIYPLERYANPWGIVSLVRRQAGLAGVCD